MDFIKKNGKGLLFCLALAVPSAVLGKLFPVVGGPVFAILIGMILALVIKKRDSLESGVKYTSKKILQYAVVLLGFGLNLEVVMETGKQSLPIIVCTIYNIIGNFLYFASHDEYSRKKSLHSLGWDLLFAGDRQSQQQLRLSMRMMKESHRRYQ